MLTRASSFLVYFLVAVLLIIMIFRLFSIYLGIRLNQGALDLVMKARTRMAESNGGNGPSLTPQEIKALKTSIIVLLVAAAIVLRGFLFLLTSIAYAVGLNLLRVRASFKKVMALIAWSNLIPHLGAILIAIFSIEISSPERIAQTDPSHFSSLLITNLATLIGDGGSRPLRAALDSLDLFVIWFLVLLTLGFSMLTEGGGTVDKRLTKGQAAGLVFGLWIAWVVVKIGIAIVWK